MKKIRMPSYIFILFVSLGVIVAASIFDRFDLPFQDWETISEQQKQSYMQRSEICSYFKYLGEAGFFIGAFGSLYNVVKPNRDRQGR